MPSCSKHVAPPLPLSARERLSAGYNQRFAEDSRAFGQWCYNAARISAPHELFRLELVDLLQRFIEESHL